MAAVGRFFGRFFGRTIGDAASFAIGGSISRTIDPALQQVENEAWQAAVAAGVTKPLDAGTLAAGVAQGQVDPKFATAEAGRTGFTPDRFAKLVDIANVGPPLGQALDSFRRGQMTEAEYRTALKRLGIESQWFDDLVALKEVRLSAEVIANAVQQGHVPNDDILPPIVSGEPPYDIPLTTIPLDPVAESAAHGVTRDRLQVLSNLAGLPPPTAMLLDMWNRGYISEDAVDAGIREGHTKTKWTGPVKAMARAVLSPTEAASARLRTWITKEQADSIGAAHGYTPEQMELLFLNRGRPASPTQMWKGWARKVKGPRGVPVDYEDHAKAIAISDIRPEYAEMLWEIRWNYPPLFQLGRLVAQGSMTPERAKEIAEFELYEPKDVDALYAYWKRTAGGTVKEATAANLRAEYEGLFIDRATLVAALVNLGYPESEAEHLADLGDAGRVKGYRDRVVTAIYKAYLAHHLTEPQARVALAEDGIDANAVDSLITLWTREAGLTRHQLTQAQIVAAYRRSVLTFAQASSELQDRGLTEADAATLLRSAVTPLTDKEVTDAYDAGTLTEAQAAAQLARSGHPDDEIATILAGHGPTPTEPAT